MLALTLLLSIVCSMFGLLLVAAVTAETSIVLNDRLAGETLYAAEAAAARVASGLRTASLDAALGGLLAPVFTDGLAPGIRTLADGAILDLTTLPNLANCRQTTACSEREVNAWTSERPWGMNNPRWRLLAYGSTADLAPSAPLMPPAFVVVLIGDDGAEGDGDPLRDGLAGGGRGAVRLRAESFAVRGAHRAIEVTLVRTRCGTGEVEVDGVRCADGAGAESPQMRLRSWRLVQ